MGDRPRATSQGTPGPAGRRWAPSPTAAWTRTAEGLAVVMDRCLKVEHARFHGGLHLAGFDTGEVTSRKQRLSARR